VSERLPPAVPRPPPVIGNLEPRLAAAPCGQLLAKVPWDGPRLDPDALSSRAMLAWLR
jgi:hypothetical protein